MRRRRPFWYSKNHLLKPTQIGLDMEIELLDGNQLIVSAP